MVTKDKTLSDEIFTHHLEIADVDIKVILAGSVKEFIEKSEEKSDDAGHFQHDTKVVRLKDLKELAGGKLT